HQHIAAQSRGNGHGPLKDTRNRAGAFIATRIPVHIEAQGGFRGVGPDRGEAIAIVVVVSGPAGDAVNVFAAQPGVFNGFAASVHSQLQGGLVRWPTNIRLADTSDGNGLFKGAPGHASSFSKRGIQTSSTFSKVTRTAMPMKTSSGGQPTMFETSRRSSSSSSPMIATT